MKAKGLAALALVAVVIGFTPTLASASLVEPVTGRELGSPPPPMPIIGPTTGRELGSPPPPMPGPIAGRELGSPPPPMPLR